jgi:thiol:disulfide interchange protein DsbD
LFFAASFLGAFEIMLPNSWANKVDSKQIEEELLEFIYGIGTCNCIFFLVLGIVGTYWLKLLLNCTHHWDVRFSLALALPFMLFAMFPGWLNSLPKSGGWLNTVKVVLDFWNWL